MAIKGNNSTGLINVPGTDVTILQNSTSGDRYAVTQLHLHDYGGTGDTVEIFRSVDAVSASAERIDNIVIAADETMTSLAATIVLNPGEFLIANGGTGGTVNIYAIYTTYTGSS